MKACRSDRGVTLMELLVTIALMSIAFLTVLGGLALFLRTETAHGAAARLDGALRSVAEAVVAAPYTDCAATYDVAAGEGFSLTVTVTYWDGALPATFAPRCTSDQGAQQVTIRLTDADGRHDELVVGKSR